MARFLVSRTPILFRFTLLLTLFLLHSGEHAFCQNYRSSRLGLSFGVGSSDFNYKAPSSDFEYQFSAELATLSLSNDYLDFDLSYGNQKGSAEDDLLEMNMLEAALVGGPNLSLISAGSSSFFKSYIPLRLGFEYRFNSVLGGIPNLEAPNLYLLESTLGLGLGLLWRPPILSSRLHFRMLALTSVGIQNELGDQYEGDKRWMRNSKITTSITFAEVIGNFGLTFAYMRRSRRWSATDFTEFTDKIKSLLHPSEVPVRRTQAQFRLGLIWQVVHRTNK